MPNANHPYVDTLTFCGRPLPLKRPMAAFSARRLEAILPQIAALNAAGKSQADAAAALETTVTTLRTWLDLTNTTWRNVNGPRPLRFSQMKYLSVCSGMEAASVAWHPLGWTPVGFSEIEPFPCAILKHRFPNTPNYGSLTEYSQWPIEPGTVDLLVGGTPCQSFSVAGLRKGLEDPRGNLALVFLGLADRIKPRWIVWENVPGVLSSAGGRDFGSFLGALVELGYGFAYRVLDAQHFGVPQRRRRVFVVACLGDWRAPAEVLFESDCVRRDLKKGRAKGQGSASGAEGGVDADGMQRTVGTLCADTHPGAYSGQDAYTGRLIPQPMTPCPDNDWVGTLCARDFKGVGNQFVQEGKVIPMSSQPIPIHDQATRFAGKHGDKQDGKGNGLGIGNPGDPMNTLTQGDKHAVAYCSEIAPTVTSSGPPSPMAYDMKQHHNPQPTENIQLTTLNCAFVRGDTPLVQQPMAVRRLTPVECERLQGFPDNWSRISWKGKPEEDCPDGPRYKACGNSMAVPVMRWIGERIQAVESSQAHA